MSSTNMPLFNFERTSLRSFMYTLNNKVDNIQSKKISNDQELIQSDPTSFNPEFTQNQSVLWWFTLTAYLTLL